MERPGITKYQALFEAEEVFDRYRLAFFMNTAHNAAASRQDRMLDAVEVLAEELACAGNPGDAALLRRGREDGN